MAASGCGLQEAVQLPGDTAIGGNEALDALMAHCATVPANTCNGEPGCTRITGRPLTVTPGGLCYDAAVPLEILGCRATGEDCGFNLAFATGPRGDLWWFPDTCLPDGFTLFRDENPGDCD